MSIRHRVIWMMVLSSATLLIGCSTAKPPGNQDLSPDRTQFLSPRQVYETMDPWARSNLEKRALEGENIGENVKNH